MSRTRRRSLARLAAAIMALAAAGTAPATAAQPGSGKPDAAPFVVLLKITIKPGQAEQFVAAMNAQAAASRGELGVLDFRVFQSDADPAVFYSVESYREGRFRGACEDA